MVGPLGAVHPHGAAEFRHYQHGGLRPCGSKPIFQPGETCIQFPQHARQARHLGDVSIPTADLHRRDARAIVGAQHLPRCPCQGGEGVAVVARRLCVVRRQYLAWLNPRAL